MMMSKKFFLIIVAMLALETLPEVKAGRIAKQVLSTAFWSSDLHAADKKMAKIENDFAIFEEKKARLATMDITYEDALYDLATFRAHIIALQENPLSLVDLANCNFVCEKMQQEISQIQVLLKDFYQILDAYEYWTLKMWHSWVNLQPFYDKVKSLQSLLFALQSRVQLVPGVIKEHEETLALEKEKLAIEARRIKCQEETNRIQEEASRRKANTRYLAPATE